MLRDLNTGRPGFDAEKKKEKEKGTACNVPSGRTARDGSPAPARAVTRGVRGVLLPPSAHVASRDWRAPSWR